MKEIQTRNKHRDRKENDVVRKKGKKTNPKKKIKDGLIKIKIVRQKLTEKEILIEQKTE